MSKRTWSCVPCRKSYLHKKSITSVECPNCHGPCESVDSYVRVPSPNQPNEWDKFWSQYKAEKAARAEQEKAFQKTIAAVSPKIKKSLSRMWFTYIDGICAPVIETLNHSAGLPAHQLAGHAANLEFWINEATHALMVIDGYQERFKRLRAGQAEYEKKHGIASTNTPIQRSSKHLARQELRRSVIEAIERFLTRCHREGLLSAKKLKTAMASLGHDKIGIP